jgi:peroxiredoxin
VVAQEWSGRATFVGVAWAGDRGHFQRFIDRHGISFPTIDDSPGDVFDHFGVVTQPAVMVVAPDGDVQSLVGRADGESISGLLAGVSD